MQPEQIKTVYMGAFKENTNHTTTTRFKENIQSIYAPEKTLSPVCRKMQIRATMRYGYTHAVSNV